MTDWKKVLLLQAPVPGPQNRVVAKPSAIPPLGLGYLASVLLREGFEVRIVDMDVEDVGAPELREILRGDPPAIVGISTTTLTFKNGLRVAKVVKEALPECQVCLGGPHATVLPEEALRHRFVDFVVRGEGEVTFLELCLKLADGRPRPLRVVGTAERRGSQIQIHPARARIRDLDALPFPARHLMPLDAYNIPGTIVTSRGCPFACGFCAGPTVLGRRYVARSPEDVAREVQMCVDMFQMTSFYFVDDTMTHQRRRLREICARLKGIRIPAALNRELKWTCESRADIVSLELLQEMRAAGCTTIQFGLESGSQKLLDQLGKKVTLKQIHDAVAWSREAGVSPVLSMVVPHPEETRETLRETFAFVRRLYDAGAEKIVPAMLTLFPGTRFHERREELGFRMLTEDTDEYNMGTPMVTTRHLDLPTIVNAYSQLLLLTQALGGDQVGGVNIESSSRTLQPPALFGPAAQPSSARGGTAQP